MENGTGKVSHTIKLPQIAKALGTTTEFLITGTGPTAAPWSAEMPDRTPPAASSVPPLRAPEAQTAEQPPATVPPPSSSPLPSGEVYIPWSAQKEELAQRWLAREPLQDIATALNRGIGPVAIQLKQMGLDGGAPYPKSGLQPVVADAPQPARVVAEPAHEVAPVSDFDLQVVDNEFQLVFRKRTYRVNDKGEFTEPELHVFAAVSVPPPVFAALHDLMGRAKAAYEREIGEPIAPQSHVVLAR
jgi:hypothetical protein